MKESRDRTVFRILSIDRCVSPTVSNGWNWKCRKFNLQPQIKRQFESIADVSRANWLLVTKYALIRCDFVWAFIFMLYWARVWPNQAKKENFHCHRLNDRKQRKYVHVNSPICELTGKKLRLLSIYRVYCCCSDECTYVWARQYAQRIVCFLFRHTSNSK